VLGTASWSLEVAAGRAGSEPAARGQGIRCALAGCFVVVLASRESLPPLPPPRWRAMNEAVPRLVPADALRPLLDFHAPVIAHAPVIVFLLVESPDVSGVVDAGHSIEMRNECHGVGHGVGSRSSDRWVCQGQCACRSFLAGKPQ
jgi:hypothetical protein